MSFTYIRWQFIECSRNLMVLVCAVAMLFFLGDLTENLPAWLGEQHSLFLKLTEFALDLTELYARLLGFLVALASLWYWIRAGAAGLLTAVEAAGIHPGAHVCTSMLWLLVAIGGQFAFEYQGSLLFHNARAEIQRVKDGKQLQREGQQSLLSEPGRVQVFHEDGRKYADFDRDAGSRSIEEIREYRDHQELLFQRSSQLLTYTEHHGFPQMQRSIQMEPEFIFEPAVSIGRSLTSALLLWLAFLFVRRHGRSSGLSEQAVKSVIVLAIVWVGYEAAAFGYQGWSIPQWMVPLYAAVIYSFFWTRRFLRNR